VPHDDNNAWQDQGRQERSFWLLGGRGNYAALALDRRAEELQTPAEYVMDSVHHGAEPWEQSFLEIMPGNVWVLAIKRAGKVIKEALAETDKCPLHLEDTAGAGGTLGRSFEELEALLDASGGGQRLGICLDSCHLFASGYDVSTPKSLGEVVDQFDRVVGLKRLGSLHINDSAVALGSNRDRHAILGEGVLGEKGCAVILSEPRFESLPCVLETGRDHGAPALEDVELAKKLRTRGKSNRRRARR